VNLKYITADYHQIHNDFMLTRRRKCANAAIAAVQPAIPVGPTERNDGNRIEDEEGPAIAAQENNVNNSDILVEAAAVDPEQVADFSNITHYLVIL
jgi:hypothetical protein